MCSRLSWRASREAFCLLMLFTLCASSARASLISVCGAALPPNTTSWTGICVLAGGTFTGTVSEAVNTPTMYVIDASGIYSGAGSMPLQGRHVGFNGEGKLFSSFVGILDDPNAPDGASAGGESFMVQSLAGPTYNGINPVNAIWQGAAAGGNMPILMGGYQESWGWYSASTDLTGLITWNTNGAGNEQFDLTHTAQLGEEVPEPETPVMLGLALLIFGNLAISHKR